MSVAMANQTHQAQKLELLGISDADETADETTGDFKVRCPRCGFEETNLPRHKAASLSHKSGCPECPKPTNDLGAGPEEDPEPLVNTGLPLAVSPMN